MKNELFSIIEGELTISQYFNKVKSLFGEIFELNATSKILECRIRRIIIHGLRPEFGGFIVAIQGWLEQPSLVNLKNLMIDQEALIKQMLGILIKKEEEKALFSYRGRNQFLQPKK